VKIVNNLLLSSIVFGLGVGTGLRVDLRPEKVQPMQPPPREVDPQPSVQPATEVEMLPDSFPSIMRAIAMMESSGGKNQKPNVDGIVGVGQIEKSFYADAKEYAKTDDFPTYEDVQGYDQAAFDATCIVAKHWFKRYGANTPYLMFARYRKGLHGEKTETGQAYAEKAMKLLKGF